MSSELPIPNINAPQELDLSPSSICTTGKPPQIILGILLWLIRRHFSYADWISNEDLKSNVWTADPTTSGIMIEPVTMWHGANTQTLQSRPAILVKRNTFSQSKVGIGDKYMIGTKARVDNSQSVGNNTIDNGAMYGTLLAGSFTYFCIANTGAAAEAVGTETYFELLEFSPLIRDDFGFSKFQVMEIGGISKLEESAEHWVVPITVNTVVAHDWVLRPEMPYFKSVSLNTQ